MTFLKTINVSHLMIRCNFKIYKLTNPQINEILNYQKGLNYNKYWLKVNSLKPYFRLANNKYKEEIIYIDKNIKN